MGDYLEGLRTGNSAKSRTDKVSVLKIDVAEEALDQVMECYVVSARI